PVRSVWRAARKAISSRSLLLSLPRSFWRQSGRSKTNSMTSGRTTTAARTRTDPYAMELFRRRFFLFAESTVRFDFHKDHTDDENLHCLLSPVRSGSCRVPPRGRCGTGQQKHGRTGSGHSQRREIRPPLAEFTTTSRGTRHAL